MSSPQGLLIGNARKPWRVGRIIGRGVCGTVHELKRNGINDQYVVKAAPLPPPTTNPKKKRSAAQRNADMLYYESLMYQTKFPNLQGTMIPRTPFGSSEPKLLEDEHGYRFLTMERMDGPLTDVIGLLKSQRRGGKAIKFGPVAVALLDIVEAVHDGHHLLVDVKTENFMLSGDQGPIEQRVRMIDLGLVRPLRDFGGKLAPNTRDAQLCGTPLYSSLYVHEGQTFGRRDDMEAMGYVISELLMGLTGAADSLPWSNGESDDDIHRMKEREVLNNKSSFYVNMSADGNGGNRGPAHIMWNYFKEVRKLEYKEKPDYDMFKDMLSQLSVKVAGTAAAATGKRTTPVRKKESAAAGNKRVTPARKKESAAAGSNKRTTSTRGRSDKKSGTRKAAPRVVADFSDSEDEAYTGRVTRARGKKRPSPRSEATGSSKARRRGDSDEYFDGMVEESSDGDAFESCQDETESMEWVSTPDENAAPTNKAEGGGVGLKVLCTGGPHEGESFLLLQDTADTFVLGSNPKSSHGDRFRLTEDLEVDPSHVKLVLHEHRGVCSVAVTDLKSSTGTWLNSNEIPKGKERRGFVNDKISFGDSELTILRLPEGEDTPKKRAAVPASPARKKPATKKPASKKAAAKKDPPTPARGVGLCFEIVEGPHDGESFLLKKGTMVLGTNPKATSGGSFVIDDDEADSSHAKLELSVSKKLCSVKVTDLKSSTGTFLNGQRIPKGSHRQAFINDSIRIGDSTIRITTL